MVRKTNKGRKYRKYNKRRAARTARRGKAIIYATPKMIYKLPLNLEKLEIEVLAGTVKTFNFNISLEDIAGNDLTAFINLYDEFKITGFTWTLKPRGNVANANFTSEAIGLGEIYDNVGIQYYSVLDHTDVTNLLDADEALEYASCRKHVSWKPASRYVPAYCPVLTKDVDANNMLTVRRPPWLQLSTQTIGGTVYNQVQVAHIGCKLFFEENPNQTSIFFDLYIKAYCMFRNKK